MLESLDRRLTKLNVLDIGMIKLSLLFAGIILAKLFTPLINMQLSVLLVLVFGFALVPFYKFWITK